MRRRDRDGLAETEVDQTLLQPRRARRSRAGTGSRCPSARSSGFALETDGVLVEGEVIERKQAAATYEAAIAARNDPALLEWIDGRTERARIFPVPARGTRRVVLRYQQLLPRRGQAALRLPARGAGRTRDARRSTSSRSSVELGASSSSATTLATLADARVEDAEAIA